MQAASGRGSSIRLVDAPTKSQLRYVVPDGPVTDASELPEVGGQVVSSAKAKCMMARFWWWRVCSGGQPRSGKFGGSLNS